MKKINKEYLKLTDEEKDEILLDLRVNFLNGKEGKEFTFIS